MLSCGSRRLRKVFPRTRPSARRQPRFEVLLEWLERRLALSPITRSDDGNGTSVNFPSLLQVRGLSMPLLRLTVLLELFRSMSLIRCSRNRRPVLELPEGRALLAAFSPIPLP